MGRLKSSKKNTKRGKVMKQIWLKKKLASTYLQHHDYCRPSTDINPLTIASSSKHSDEIRTAVTTSRACPLEDHEYCITTAKNQENIVILDSSDNDSDKENDFNSMNLPFLPSVGKVVEVASSQITTISAHSQQSVPQSHLLKVVAEDNLESENKTMPEWTSITDKDKPQTPEKSPSDPQYSFISEAEFDSITAHELCVEKVSPETKNLLPGHRIVDLDYVLKWAMKLQVDHSKICTTGKMQLISEDRRSLGLVSKLQFKCDMCEYETTKFTEDPNHIKSKINYGAVWGTLACGSTFSHMNEQLSALDIPSLSYRLFHRIELELGDNWKSQLWTSMEDAGKEEYNLAMGKGRFDKNQNVWTKVYVDGGWSHRSYGHNYNAASGTAIIIGELTRKLLFLGVRNKYCSVCARAANRQQPPHAHICFKNWVASSGAMEADIVVEGFKQSQTMHNLKYLKLVGDGDSSVFAKIKEFVSYGDEVEKIECKNHAIKNYGSGLYKIKNDTKINALGRKFLTMRNIKNLQNVALKQLEVNANGDVEKLKKDWANGPNHVFGNHSNCSSEYCNTVGNTQDNRIPELEKTEIHYHINSILDRLMGKAHKLISNETNNSAELFMSFLAKYNAGKRLNLTQRGSFETRSHISGLKYNEGINWQSTPWKKLMEESPGKNFKKYLSESVCAHESRVKRKLDFGNLKNKPRKRKATVQLKATSKSYGPTAVQAPLNAEELISEKKRILEKMQVTPTEILRIERATVGQWQNSLYKELKKNRMTASNFGAVIKRRKTTRPDNLVKIILGITYAKSEAIEYGKSKETVARQKFAASRPRAKIQDSGIFIYEKYGYLAASPDGLVGDNGILEIKCLHKVHKSGKTLEEILRTDKTLCVEVHDGRIRLKRNHNYYYQVQGQLNIARKDICFFIIYINDQQPLYVDVILRDRDLWEKQMLPKLTSFYETHVLDAIANRNVIKSFKNH